MANPTMQDVREGTATIDPATMVIRWNSATVPPGASDLYISPDVVTVTAPAQRDSSVWAILLVLAGAAWLMSD